jgi:nucleoside diphosphate kinase
VLYVLAADRVLDQRCALALHYVRQNLMRRSLGDFKNMVREQFFVLQLDGERAVNAIASLVRETEPRAELLKQTRAIVGASDPPSAAASERLARLSRLLATPIATTSVVPALADQ